MQDSGIGFLRKKSWPRFVEPRVCPRSYATTPSRASIDLAKKTHASRTSNQQQLSGARGNRSSTARRRRNQSGQLTEKGAEGTYLDTARPAAMATNGQGISEGGDKENRASERAAKALRLSLEDRRRREGSGWVCVWRGEGDVYDGGRAWESVTASAGQHKKRSLFPPPPSLSSLRGSDS